MSFTQTTAPGGRKETRCDRCGHGQTSLWAEVLRAWARTHICPNNVAAAHQTRTDRPGGAR